jgi:hypothetical protein
MDTSSRLGVLYPFYLSVVYLKTEALSARKRNRKGAKNAKVRKDGGAE